MFIGMEHIVLSNYLQADESLDAANAMCDGDPLLINERGVMAFNHGRYLPCELLAQPVRTLTSRLDTDTRMPWTCSGPHLRLRRLRKRRRRPGRRRG